MCICSQKHCAQKPNCIPGHNTEGDTVTTREQHCWLHAGVVSFPDWHPQVEVCLVAWMRLLVICPFGNAAILRAHLLTMQCPCAKSENHGRMKEESFYGVPTVYIEPTAGYRDHIVKSAILFLSTGCTSSNTRTHTHATRVTSAHACQSGIVTKDSAGQEQIIPRPSSSWSHSPSAAERGRFCPHHCPQWLGFCIRLRSRCREGDRYYVFFFDSCIHH